MTTTIKMTALTFRTIARFLEEYDVSTYTKKETDEVEFAAYIANMNTNCHNNWTDADIYNKFISILNERVNLTRTAA